MMWPFSVLCLFRIVPGMHIWRRGVLKKKWGYAKPRLRNIHWLKLEPHHFIIWARYTDRWPKTHTQPPFENLVGWFFHTLIIVLWKCTAVSAVFCFDLNPNKNIYLLVELSFFRFISVFPWKHCTKIQYFILFSW